MRKGRGIGKSENWMPPAPQALVSTHKAAPPSIISRLLCAVDHIELLAFLDICCVARGLEGGSLCIKL